MYIRNFNYHPNRKGIIPEKRTVGDHMRTHTDSDPTFALLVGPIRPDQARFDLLFGAGRGPEPGRRWGGKVEAS